MLPLPGEIVDIRLLVPEPPLDVIELPSLLLELVAERRNIGIIQPLFELLHPPGELSNLPGSRVQGSLQCRKVCSASLHLLNDLLEVCCDPFPFLEISIGLFQEFLGGYGQALQLLFDLGSLFPLCLHLFAPASDCALKISHICLQSLCMLAKTPYLVLDRRTKSTDRLLERTTRHGPALLKQFPFRSDHPISP